MIISSGKNARVWWIALLAAGLLSAPAVAADAPDAEAVHAYRVTDGGLFQQELQAAGALKFCDNTEDLLRAGQFERALLRYSFLKRQIRAQAGYQPLVHLINQRLDFLKSQLKLPAADYAALPGPIIRKKPVGKTQPTPAAQAAPADAPSTPSKPAAAVDQAPPTQAAETAAPSPAVPSPSPEDLAAAPTSQAPESPPQPTADQAREDKPPGDMRTGR